jgi:hypothetical protein
MGHADMKRLNIVVPYRDREAHLKQLIPGLSLYFERDKADRNIPYQVLVIEQENGQPFNRGALKNIGFLLGRDYGDYTCFHDVDYIPIWADYSWPEHPVSIVWYGAEYRPFRVNASSGMIQQDMSRYYGGVVLVPNDDFARVNGFSNTYWGWGYEDLDLKNRLERAGIVMGRRKGTFRALHHDHDAYDDKGALNAAARANADLFTSRSLADGGLPEDGLSTLAFEIVKRRVLQYDGPKPERLASWEMITVRLGIAPPK